MELIEKFGIDLRTLIAQIINFLIVLGVLYAFAYKPILKILRERSEKVEKSLKDAESLERRVAEMEREKEAVILRAKKEAQEVLKQSEHKAQQEGQQLIVKAQGEVKEIIQKARREIQQAKDHLVLEAREDIAQIVVATAEKVIVAKLAREETDHLVQKTLSEVYSQKSSRTRS